MNIKKRQDSLTKEQRSFCMSQVKSQDTKIELLVRSLLFKRGYRFKKNVKSLPGKPDVVFVKEKIAVFIDGDFWHGKNFKKEKLKFTGADQKQINELLEVFKLADSKNFYPNELSGGMKKRLALIRAQLLRPKVLILDETLGSLDRGMIKEIMAEMIPHWRNDNVTVLFVTHHFEEIKEYIDQRISF